MGDLKKIALCGLVAGFAYLSAQEVLPQEETQEVAEEQLAMGKCVDRAPGPEECPPSRVKGEIKSNCGGGGANS